MDTKELLITAQLARLALTDEDARKLNDAVTQMLEYFSSMQEIDVAALEPTTHALQSDNRIRKDIPEDFESTDSLIEEAPEADDRFLTIPQVL
ncbi:MAG: Asp-tRNA(Asn)/Glu-tRNA(Gln) amidotransferase subunit GatC [Spirochaetia bacterium]